MPNAFDGLGAEAPYVPDYLQDEIQFRIDNDLRTIAIPADGVVLGVVGDKNVNHVNFQMPAWYNGFNMSLFQARINFIDASGNANYYTVTDMTVMTPEGNEVVGVPSEDDIIYFTWLVDSYATGYVGQVRFNVRLTKHDTSVNPAVLSQAFNTQINSCQVLEGIQLADEIAQDQAEDILFHFSSELGDITEGFKHDLETKAAETLESIPDDYDSISDDIVELSGRISVLNDDLNNLSNTNKVTKLFSSMTVARENSYINFPSGTYSTSPDHKVVSLSLANVKSISYYTNQTVQLAIGGVKTSDTVVKTFSFNAAGETYLYEFDESYNNSTAYFNWFGKDSSYVDRIVVEYRNVKHLSDMPQVSEGYVTYEGTISHSYEHSVVGMSLKNVERIVYTPKATVSLPFGAVRDANGDTVFTFNSSTANVKAEYTFDETYNDCTALFNWFGKGSTYLSDVTVEYRNVSYTATKTVNELFDKYAAEKGLGELALDRNSYFIDYDGSYTYGPSHQTRKLDLRNVEKVTFGSSSTTPAVTYGVIRDKNTGTIYHSLGSNIAGTSLTIDDAWRDSELVISFFEYASGSSSTYIHDIYIHYYPAIDYNIKNSIKNGITPVAPTVTETKFNNCVRKPFVFNEKEAIFTGDSITYGFTSGTTTVHNSGDYPTLFSSKVGLSHANYAQGGACFCSGKNEVTTIPTQVQNNTNKNCDFLFIAGGVNDWQIGATLSEFITTISTLCTYINTNYSQSTQVIWITPINEGGWETMSTPTATLQEFRNAITRTVMSNDTYARFSVVQGNTFNFPDENDDDDYISAMFGDKLHPSALGYKTLYLNGLCTALC